MLENKDSRPIGYFSAVIAEYYEGYIGGSYEDDLFIDASQACANELAAISKGHDSRKLLLFLTAIFQFAERSKEKGQARFLNIPPASCLILCQGDPNVHRWSIAEAVPGTMSALISQQQPGPFQRQTFRALVECLVIGKQYALSLSASLRKNIISQFDSIEEAEAMLGLIFNEQCVL